jgi:putative acetyltransferase
VQTWLSVAAIRPEAPQDRAAVRTVNTSAFDTAAEADLVDRLRQQASPLVSLVTEVAGEVVGHILFSPVSLGEHRGLQIMGLAPMAVAPHRQRRGIGSALVRAGLQRCRQLGAGAVVVLGHPAYYPRFGFQPAARLGIGCEYDAPADAFMLIELQREYLRGVEGTVRYHAAFSGLG